MLKEKQNKQEVKLSGNDKENELEIKLNERDKDRYRYILTENLKWERETPSIGHILKSIEEEGWLDRNFNNEYIWSNERATYFIETILLKYEIQPIIIYTNNDRNVVCDGFQRLTVIKMFVNNELRLSEKGLHQLSFLKGKTFNDLDKEDQDYFLNNYSLELKRFKTIKSNLNLTLADDEYIEKQLYLRNNSGIELKPFQMQKASYFDEPITSKITSMLREDEKFRNDLIALKILDPKKKRNMIDEGMVRVRELIAGTYCPIGRFLHFATKEDRMKKGYIPYICGEKQEEIIMIFNQTVERLIQLINHPIFQQNPKLNTRRFLFCTYWLLAVCLKDNVFPIEKFNIEEYINFCIARDTKPSYFKHDEMHQIRPLKDVYQLVMDYAQHRFSVNMNHYFEQDKKLPIEKEEYAVATNFQDLKNIQYKISSMNRTIDEVCDLMEKRVFILRGPYQRQEEINLKQASCQIESLFMDIPLPKIIIHQYQENGREIYEVLDGQQRLASIIGFKGRLYLNELGELEKTQKHKFQLQGLKVFTDCNGKTFDGKSNISEHLQKKIDKYVLEFSIIKESENSVYSPKQNFKRINESINNLKENTYRRWNVECDKTVMDSIENTVKKHIGIFFSTFQRFIQKISCNFYNMCIL